MIKITPPKGFGSGASTKLTNEEGDPIKGVRSVIVKLDPENIVTAEVTVSAQMEEVWALPFMSEESFFEAAKRYGYVVLPVNPDSHGIVGERDPEAITPLKREADASLGETHVSGSFKPQEVVRQKGGWLAPVRAALEKVRTDQ
ncbi:MAG: hypothetical protein AAF732_21640 [Pseudomonadota bacterium]